MDHQQKIAYSESNSHVPDVANWHWKAKVSYPRYARMQISRKLLETEDRFQRTTNRKWHMAHRMVTWLIFKMTDWRQFVFFSSYLREWSVVDVRWSSVETVQKEPWTWMISGRTSTCLHQDSPVPSRSTRRTLSEECQPTSPTTPLIIYRLAALTRTRTGTEMTGLSRMGTITEMIAWKLE